MTAVQLGAEHDTQMGDTYADDVIIKARSGKPGPIPGPDGGPNNPGPGTGGGVPAAASTDIQRVAAANPNLGTALSQITCGLAGGGCRQEYQSGLISWSSATNAHVSVGGIRVAWAAAGGEGGRLGYPATDVVCGLRSGGCYQMYQGGAIIWSPTTGSQLSMGAIRVAWAATGFENGRLGYPTSNEVCGLRSGRCLPDVPGRRITWSAATDFHAPSSAGSGLPGQVLAPRTAGSAIRPAMRPAACATGVATRCSRAAP